MGLADMRTSRGAFLFFLPWKGHTVVGTTDSKSPAQTSPSVSEDEIQYLLNEVGRYLSDDLQVLQPLSTVLQPLTSRMTCRCYSPLAPCYSPLAPGHSPLAPGHSPLPLR